MLFSTDNFFPLPGGARLDNGDKLPRLHEMFVNERVHTADLRAVALKDDTVVLSDNVSMAWLIRFGFTGMPVCEIVHAGQCATRATGQPLCRLSPGSRSDFKLFWRECLSIVMREDPERPPSIWRGSALATRAG
jgi:hypothetical protein